MNKASLAAAGRALALMTLLAGPVAVDAAGGVDTAARPELAPDGTLKVGIIVENPIAVTRDPHTGALKGLAVDISNAMAERLGTPWQAVPFASGRELAEGLKSGRAAVAFLARAPAREKEFAFTRSYVEIESTLLVAPGADIRSLEDIDRKGIRIAVIEKSSQDFLLSARLKLATLVRLKSGATKDSIEALRERRAEAVAGNTHRLSGAMTAVPGARLLPGRLLKTDYALALAKGKPAALAFLEGFVAEAKVNGLIARAIAGAGLKGVVVAP